MRSLRSFFNFLLVIFSGCSARSQSNVIPKDVNVFVQNMEVERHVQLRHFLGIETLQKVKLGVTEAELYLVLGSDSYKTRYSFNQVLAKRLRKMKYIPVTKAVTFSGYKTKIIESNEYTSYKPIEELGVAFFFYRDRLIHMTIVHEEKREGKWTILPDSSEEVLYVSNNRDTEEPLSYAITNAGGDSKYYGFVNGYLGEKFTSKGDRYFVPLVTLKKHQPLDFLSKYCKNSYYWESSDYEVELKKSGYYKLKAKLDQEFENKTGYWAEKETP